MVGPLRYKCGVAGAGGFGRVVLKVGLVEATEACLVDNKLKI